MSQCIVTMDASNAILANDVDLESMYCDIVFKYKLDGINRINIENLKFGFTFYRDGIALKTFSYPPSGVKLLCSDQSYIHIESFDLSPNILYSIELWYQPFAQDKIIKFRSMLSPKPKGLAGWIWNDLKKEYESPVNKPVDGYAYDWDELRKEWHRKQKYLSSLCERS